MCSSYSTSRTPVSPRSADRVLLLALFLATGARAGADVAVPDVSPAELHKSNPELKLTWFRAEGTLSPFDRVQVAPAEIRYREVAMNPAEELRPGARTEFPVKEKDREKLQQDVDRIFREELGKRGHYALADAPGPGVLVLRPTLLDVVSRVPPERPDRSESWLDTVGDATLVLTVVDGASGETLARAVDRRTARPVSGYGTFGALRSTAPTVWHEVQYVARSWGRAIGDRTDQLYYQAKPK